MTGIRRSLVFQRARYWLHADYPVSVGLIEFYLPRLANIFMASESICKAYKELEK
ncbi:MAG: hypothetical protein L3J71_13510 [Victivallaceae bacterium]|nr:hypothetical protein [Victivallaceae bacterium]